jgi:hypothetical protein
MLQLQSLALSLGLTPASGRRVFSRRRPPISKPREDATRWRDGGGRADGLNAEQAARAVGVPRSTLYRWGKDAAPRNRRPRRVRPKTWAPALRQAAERLRQDFPMWGGAKIGPLLRAEGFEVSDATSGACSPNSWRAALFRPCRPCADAPMRAAGRPSAASHAACRAVSP